ncbi:MAG: hypothetical protein KKF68_00920 [Nanoarchaeota archaeon]|nr:hypothetical protein [Nanoarchaeota archaeon]
MVRTVYISRDKEPVKKEDGIYVYESAIGVVAESEKRFVSPVDGKKVSYFFSPEGRLEEVAKRISKTNKAECLMDSQFEDFVKRLGLTPELIAAIKAK